MATTRLYLDSRKVKRGEPAPLTISVTKNGVAAYIPLQVKILPSQWDAKTGKVKDNPNKTVLNAYIQSIKQKVDTLLLQLTANGELHRLSAIEIRNIIKERLDPKENGNSLFLNRFKAYAKSRIKQRTRELYQATLKRIEQYDKKAGQLSFDNINKDWLSKFDTFLMQYEPSQNSRSIHFRNIRAVFNDAIDNEITIHYPFRKFMVRPVPTVKRAYSVERLRELFNYPVLPHEQKYLDMFKLIFFFIGINVVDLCNLVKVENGRIIYKRSKTGRIYNIKVEPEAQEIIDRYRGKKKLLNIADNFALPHTYVCTINRALKQIGPRTHTVSNGKSVLQFNPAFPDLSTYVARHTWATIAYEIGIPNETIAEALGHSFGNRTTSIYIKSDLRKVDEANRKVMDYVLDIDGR